MALPEKTRIMVMAPVVRGRKGEHQKELDAARKGGYARVRVDGIFMIFPKPSNRKKTKSTISKWLWIGWSSARIFVPA